MDCVGPDWLLPGQYSLEREDVCVDILNEDPHGQHPVLGDPGGGRRDALRVAGRSHHLRAEVEDLRRQRLEQCHLVAEWQGYPAGCTDVQVIKRPVERRHVERGPCGHKTFPIVAIR